MKRGEPLTPRSQSSKTTAFKYLSVVNGHDEPSLSEQLKVFLPEELKNELIDVPLDPTLVKAAMASAKVTGAIIHVDRAIGIVESEMKSTKDCLADKGKTTREMEDKAQNANVRMNDLVDRVEKLNVIRHGGRTCSWNQTKK